MLPFWYRLTQVVPAKGQLNVCVFVSSQDNAVWDVRMDEQIMSWAVQRPEDWQLGGRCEALMWGGGRIGQLGEAGRTALTPTTAQSFACAQQVK